MMVKLSLSAAGVTRQSPRSSASGARWVIVSVIQFAAVVWQCSTICPASELVLATKSRHVAQPIAIEVPCGTRLDTAGAWELQTCSGPEAQHVAAQLSVAVHADGLPDAERHRVLAILPPATSGAESRQWRLIPGTAPATPAFEFVELSPQSLELREGAQRVWAYNHGVITREDLPPQDHRHSRACYLHPLYGLSGEILTDDFPADHYHHHGVFWTWPHVLVEGQPHDLWAGPTMRQQFIRWLAREAGPVAAVLGVENGWYVGDELVLVERIWMRTFAASAEDRAVDLEMYFTPQKEIVLQGAEEKSYGGLTVRFAPGPRAETVITVPTGPTTDDLPDTPLAWADFTSRFGQLEHRSGAAIFVPPQHPDYPPTWLTRYYGPLCVGWPGVHARNFPPGTPFGLEYRIWLHRQAVELADLEQVYASYCEGRDVAWVAPL
ncbi:MAG: PmoA family protein [Pirellulaceae bacterium]|jgi:hypothetical protein|nr:PmoA family protein [Pirellulaceae bacterium]